MVKLGLVKRECVATSIHITVRCTFVEDLNTNFDDGTTMGWTALSTTPILSVVNGRLRVQKQGGGSGTVGVQQSIMATSGFVYDFTITIDNAFTSNSTVVLELIDPNNTVIYTQSLGNGNTNTFTHQFTANTTGSYIIKVYRVEPPNSSGSFYIDDALITHEEEVTQTLCEDFAGYRYGFNGKEKDGEVSGEGNQYDYGFRIYNPRLGRFLSVDPMFHTFPWWTPYQYASNNPLKNIDLDGLESKESISSKIDCPLCQGKEPQIRVQETKQKPRPIHRKAIGRITIVQRDNENNPTGLGASLGVEVKSKNEFADNFDYRNPRFVNKLRININGIDYEGPGFIITSNDDGGGQIRIIIARNDADAPLSEGEQMQVDFFKNQIEAGTILSDVEESVNKVKEEAKDDKKKVETNQKVREQEGKENERIMKRNKRAIKKGKPREKLISKKNGNRTERIKSKKVFILPFKKK